MDTNHKLASMHWRAILSTLWLYYLINMVFRDLHELFRDGFLQQMLTGIVNGNTVTEGTLLAAGIVLQIPLGMIVLARVLPDRINRWANIIAAVMVLLSVATTNANPDADNVMFAIMEAIALLVLIWLAWRGPRPAALSLTVSSQGDDSDAQ